MTDDIVDETAKRRELQLLLLRGGYTQDEARGAAAEWTMPQVDEALERMRKSAMHYPERQIAPPGTVDLADVKSQREDAISETEEAEYFQKRDRLAALMAQSFSPPEMPLAVLQALLDVLENNGIDRLDAMADIIKEVELLRNFADLQRHRSKTQ